MQKGSRKTISEMTIISNIFSLSVSFALHWYVMIIPVNNNSLKNCCCLFWTLVYMRYLYVWFWAEFLNFLFTQSIWCPISEIPPEVGNEHFLDHYMIFRFQVLNFVWEVPIFSTYHKKSIHTENMYGPYLCIRHLFFMLSIPIAALLHLRKLLHCKGLIDHKMRKRFVNLK